MADTVIELQRGLEFYYESQREFERRECYLLIKWLPLALRPGIKPDDLRRFLKRLWH